VIDLILARGPMKFVTSPQVEQSILATAFFLSLLALAELIFWCLANLLCYIRTKKRVSLDFTKSFLLNALILEVSTFIIFLYEIIRFRDIALIFFDGFNLGMDYLIARLLICLLIVGGLWYTINRIGNYIRKRENPARGIFLGVIMFVEIAFVGYAIIQFPITMAKAVSRSLAETPNQATPTETVPAQTQITPTPTTPTQTQTTPTPLIPTQTQTTLPIPAQTEVPSTITPPAQAAPNETSLEKKITQLSWTFRWILLFLFFPPYIYFVTRKYSGPRGLFTTFIILAISYFGWLFEGWIGILLISFPIYTVLLYLLYYLAQVVLPSAHPEDKKERWNKFMALFTYLLGAQFPVWIAKESAGRDFEIRIKGNNFSGGIEPGIVWTHSHQVAGISSGIEFTQVEGPGIIFTKIFDRPISLVDLRPQIRTVDFEAITKDGIAFKAVIFSVFVIDFEDWPKKDWKLPELERMAADLRQNPFLEKGIRVDRKIGSYWYSTARVKSILSTAGINTNPKDGEAGPTVYWDEWAFKQIENAARQVLSQRNMDELWRPLENREGAGALDEIASEIKRIVESKLRRTGINLYACRVVNFEIPENIQKQLIGSWKAVWDQRITAAISDAAAIEAEEIEKAHAFAKSEILDAIADSIEKARAVNPALPRHVIALYYLHALEEIVQKRPTPGSKEATERLNMVKSYLLYNQS